MEESAAKLEIVCDLDASCSLLVELEFGTEQELRQLLNLPDVRSKIASLLGEVISNEMVQRSSKNSLGWVDDNREVVVREVLSFSPAVKTITLYPADR